MLLQKLLIEKLIKEYDYLSCDMKYKKAVIDQYMSTLRQPSINEDVQFDNEVVNVKRTPSDIEKQIYRQISKLTHPDKNLNNNEHFTAASDAYASGNFLQLLKIAKDLHIEFQIDDETLQKLEIEIKELKMQTKMLDQHLIWKWYLTKDEEEKEMLEQRIKSI